jgi:beta-lactam-binding protein with PASTA domain
MDPEVTLAPAAVVAPERGRPAGGPRPPTPGGPPPGAATLLLRLPDSDGSSTAPIVVSVKPGERATLLAQIRNESGIVDNYDLAIAGLPQGWWTVAPATAYLVPYGTSGNYEQEVEIHLHPPRSPDAQARPWSFELVATSRAYQADVARAPATAELLPYQDVASKVVPDRASGRLKARFLLTVRNRANAPTEVLLSAEDADGECQFRFAQPSITVDPGRGVEAPFTVFPDKQIWLGRPKDRSIRVSAAPVDVGDQPPQPLPAIYRQKSWLPWWLAIVAPLAAAVIALVILLQPKQTVVPSLKVAKSVFAAQKLLTAAGLKLSPTVGQVSVAGSTPGSIVDQTPAAGKRVKRGTVVTIEQAVASQTTPVPNIVGFTPQTADSTLIAAGLSLGAVSPKLDPNGKIASQIPAPPASVPKGTAVAVFLQPPAAAGAGSSTTSANTTSSGSASGSGSGSASKGGSSSGSAPKSASGGAAAKPIVIPAIAGSLMAAAQQLSHLGLVPTSTQQFSTAPPGKLVGTVPPAGQSLPAGTKVTLVVSAGFPELAYDNGTSIRIVNGASGKSAVTVPPSQAQQLEASWSPDATHIVYVQGNGQLMLLDASKPGGQPFVLTPPGSNDHVPSFAPTNASHVVAFVSGGGQNKLCFGTVGNFPLNPSCTSHPGWSLGRQVAWSPDGTKILVFGSEVGHPDVFGLIEFVSNVKNSEQASDWGQGTVVTNTSKPGQGVIDGAFSPDGGRLAMIANFGGSNFRLILAKPTDFALGHAQITSIDACQLSWRPDGKEIAVVQAQPCAPGAVGDVYGIDPSNPGSLTPIATQAEYPTWQPVTLGG